MWSRTVLYGNRHASRALLDATLEVYRKSAARCMETGDVSLFAHMAAAAATQFQVLPPAHPYYIAGDVLSDARTRDLFTAIMRKALMKACHAVTGRGHNASGFIVVRESTRASATTRALKAATMLAPALLPNIASAYVDAAAGDAPVLHKAVHTAHLRCDFPVFAASSDMGDVLTAASAARCASMVMVDNVHAVLAKSEAEAARTLREMHTLASGITTVVAAALTPQTFRAMTVGQPLALSTGKLLVVHV